MRQFSLLLCFIVAGVSSLFAHNSQPPTPEIGIAQVTDASCNGTSTGSILLEVTGGAPPYSFVWSNGGNANPLANIPAGVYSVSVSDANGETAYLAEIVVGEPDPLSVTTSITPPPCYYDNGTVLMTVTGGTPIFGQYYVSKFGTDPLVLRQMPFQFSALPGTHTAIIEDDNGCQTTYVYTVIAPPTIVFSPSVNNVSCFGGSDGSILFDAAGGTGSLEFSIDNGANYSSNPLFENLPAGTYLLRVRDANGCVTPDLPLNLDQPFTPINATATGIVASCFGISDGGISVSVANGTGTPGYQFSFDGSSWEDPDPGFTNQKTYTGLLGGSSHNIAVQDAHGCLLDLGAVAVPQPAQLTLSAVLTTPPPCFGESGEVTVNVAGGTPLQPSGGYNAYINYSPFGLQSPTYSFAANGYVGNYFIQATDANGCLAETSVTVTHPPFLYADAAVVAPAECPGGFGTVHINAYGGTAPYIGAGDQPAPEGNSTLTVTDANGCTTIVTVDVAPGMDELPPVITCPGMVEVGTNAGCTAVDVALGDALASDNCTTYPNITNDAPSSFLLGETTVTWTADDGNGNSATCTQSVVVSDDDAPSLLCPTGFSLTAQAGICGANAYWESAVANDNCGSANLIVTHAIGSFFDLGTTTVTYTATDAAGNPATCSFVITVLAATEICNGVDDDCDGVIDEGASQTWYFDADGDGFGDNSQPTYTGCTPPNNQYAPVGGDCEPYNPSIHPGATEVCNWLDDDCNGLADDGLTFIAYYDDNDGDGYGEYFIGNHCTPPANSATVPGDCNNWNAAIHPGATEVCNWLDDDCDGQIDEGVQGIFYADYDGDGFGNANITAGGCSPPNGFVTNNTDCNDGNPNIHPGAAETCDFLDNDCNGLVDDGLIFQTYYVDYDNDGYGEGPGVLACAPPGGNYPWVLQAGDCHNWNANIHPGAPEVCNWQDDDCDGQTDEGIGSTWYQDADGDGFGNPAVTAVACFAPWGYVANNQDCNDSNPNVRPGATEVCDGLDNNCDGLVDNVPSGKDLVVAFAYAPGYASAGSTINVGGQIQNLRSTTAGSNRVRWWLSNDQIPGNSNDYSPSAWRVSTNNIAGCGTKDFSKNIQLPSSGWNGAKYLIFVADGLFNIFETNENNNVWIIPITIAPAAKGGGGKNLAKTPTVTFYVSHPANSLVSADLHWVSDAPAGTLFELEHASEAADYQTIATKEQPEGTSSRMQGERFDGLLPGTNLFRVKMTLPTGEVVFSNIGALDYDASSGLLIAPNPSAGRIRLRMETLAGKPAQLVVSNTLGIEVFRQPFDEFPEGTVELDLTQLGLKDGLYNISLVYLGRAFTKRLVLAGASR